MGAMSSLPELAVEKDKGSEGVLYTINTVMLIFFIQKI